MKGGADYWIVGAAVAALLLLLNEALRWDPEERALEAMTEMVYSKAYEPFAPSPDLPGGVTQQGLAPGVVTRGGRPLLLGPDEAERAGRELASPIAPGDEAALERGRELFAIYCAVCHGADGEGRGPAVRRGVLPPPSLLAARARAMPEGQMFHVLTFGQNNMASYAGQLEPDERWMVVRHVRALQEGAER